MQLRRIGVWCAFPVIGFLFLSLSIAGCGGFGGGCTASVERAVEVSVWDAETEEPIAEGAVGTLTDGSFSETMHVAGWTGGTNSRALVLGGAFERPGVYTVRVEKTGYAVWEAHDVRVSRGVCHVNTRKLEVRLQRLP